MKERFYYMDILRLTAISLVIYAHYVMVASFAKDLPLIINANTTLPILNAQAFKLWGFDNFLIKHFNAQCGSLGVLLFFLITGYLIPIMQERYSRIEFLLNRIFRIFPALVISVLIIAVFLRYTQHVHFDSQSYLGTITLTWRFFQTRPIDEVTWTLVIEMMFYFAACFFGFFNIARLCFLQCLVLLIVFISTTSHHAFIHLLAQNSKYLNFILVGTALRLSEKIKHFLNKLMVLVFAMSLAYVTFRLYTLGYPHEIDSYASLGTQGLVIALFMTLYFMRKWFNAVPGLFYKPANITYSLYLVHCPIGLCMMVYFRNFLKNPYLLIALALLFTSIIALFIYYLIEKPGIALGRKLNNRFQEI